jgi:hypothetical protein
MVYVAMVHIAMIYIEMVHMVGDGLLPSGAGISTNPAQSTQKWTH